MTHSTANQTTLSKLLASNIDSSQAKSGSCNNDISEKQMKKQVLIVFCAANFGLIFGCMSLLSIFINSDNILGLYFGGVSAVCFMPAIILRSVIKFKKSII